MGDSGAWPELTWVPDWSGIKWLEARVRDIALRTHAFEEALARADRAGDLRLRTLKDELGEWQESAAHVRLYISLLGDKRISLTELPLHGEELGKVYRSLNRSRSRLLEELPAPAREVVRRYETEASVSFEDLRQSAPSRPLRKDDYGRLGQVLPPLLRLEEEPSAKPIPLLPEEYMLRMQAESKRLPSDLTLASLLAFLPSAWLHAVFLSLEVRAPRRSLEERQVKRDYAGLIRGHLTDPLKVPSLVRRLDDQARLLIADLLENGSMSYAQVKAYYGTDDPDGYHWLRRPASGPLSLARRLGLAYVGKVGAEYRVVTPTDLPLLREQLLNVQGG
ncbi:MAG TPA: hypothetical protein VEY30_09350 [Myxococcaceae bacterium]|nr:hypothetical protein [Myxococcaceae bacterium]